MRTVIERTIIGIDGFSLGKYTAPYTFVDVNGQPWTITPKFQNSGPQTVRAYSGSYGGVTLYSDTEDKVKALIQSYALKHSAANFLTASSGILSATPSKSMPFSAEPPIGGGGDFGGGGASGGLGGLPVSLPIPSPGVLLPNVPVVPATPSDPPPGATPPGAVIPSPGAPAKTEEKSNTGLFVAAGVAAVAVLMLSAK